MSNFNTDVNSFLNLEKFSHKKFLIFGEEPALIVKAKNHALADEDLRMVEKVYLDMEERDFEENFNQAILSNSLFNEKKIIFIRLKKNRLNKDLIASFKSISEANTENLIFIEIQSISKKIILKDILPIFKSNSHIVECSIVSDSNVIDFLAANLPQTVNNETNINNLVKLYEGNFSLLVNDLEILKVLDLKEEEKILNIFNDNGIRKSSKLIEHISKRETQQAIEILESMKSNDRNSISLLIWILARDCQALNALKDNNSNLKSLNIWDSQIKWYQAIAKRVSIQQIKESINNLDKADKSLKGLIDGDPWIKAKDVVLELST
tara:strand:+ start:189 stop:1157 length:969 start_codon:yes stop_codon:yes gene_type:complete